VANVNQAKRVPTRLIALIVSLVLLALSFAGGVLMVASILESFGSDAFLAPLRLSTQLLLQMPGFALVIVILSHLLVLGLLVRMLAVPRLRQSNLYYVLPGAILLCALYWWLACRGVVTMIERMSR